MNPEKLPLVDAVARLNRIVTERVGPDQGLEILRDLRARYPELRLELVWEDDFAGRPQYELLIGALGDATLCLSVVPSEASPFMMRGSQRWTEAQLVSVNGRRVFVHEAMLQFDAIWGESRVLQRLVDHYLVGLELERDPIDVDDESLQAEIDGFRAERGLLDPDDTRRWLADNGMSLADLEHALAGRIAERRLRRRLADGQVEPTFAADPSAWDTVALVAFPTEDVDAARACRTALADGASWQDVVERTLGSRAGAPRGARSMIFETMRRREITLLEGEALREGRIAVAELYGRGPYVISVRAVAPAVLDDATRAAIEDERFAAWLGQARAQAHVQWNWGPQGDDGH